MKKSVTNGRDSFDSILPDYGRKKLLTCADSIRELADTFRGTEQDVISEQYKETEDRRDFLWQKKLSENKIFDV